MIVPADEKIHLEESILFQRDSLYTRVLDSLGLFTRAKLIFNREQVVKLTSDLVNFERIIE